MKLQSKTKKRPKDAKRTNSRLVNVIGTTIQVDDPSEKSRWRVTKTIWPLKDGYGAVRDDPVCRQVLASSGMSLEAAQKDVDFLNRCDEVGWEKAEAELKEAALLVEAEKELDQFLGRLGTQR